MITFVIMLMLVAGVIYFGVKYARGKELERRKQQALLSTGIMPSPSPAADAAESGASAPPVVVAPRKLGISDDRAVVLNAALRSQVRQLLVASRTADLADKLFETANDEKDTASHLMELTATICGADRDPSTYIDREKQKRLTFYAARDRRKEARKAYPVTASALQAAWTELSNTLKTLSGLESEQLPDNLLPVIRMAEQAREAHKASAEYHVACAAKRSKNVRKPRPAGPMRSEYASLLADLTDQMKAVVVAHARNYAATASGIEAFKKLQELNAQCFVEPKKPTPEEVARFLRDLQVWADKILPAQRAAFECLELTQQRQLLLEQAAEKLSKITVNLSFLETELVEKDDEATLNTANKLKSEALSYALDCKRWISEWAAINLRKSPQFAASHADETQSITALQEHARKVAFAIAQRNVAQAKLEQTKYQPVVEPNAPRAVSQQAADVDKWVEQWEEYLRLSAEASQERLRIKAEIETAQHAVDARAEKIKSTAAILSKATDAAEKTFSTTISDELRVVTIAARKLCKF